MNDLIGQALHVFLGFLAIMNPIANTAVFVGLTADRAEAEKKRVAFKALLIAFVVVTAFALLGNMIFSLFGITLPALRITGGVLVFLIGYHMLNGESSKMHKGRSQDESAQDDVAISPLAVPILAGPGTIATAMNFSSAEDKMVLTVVTFAALCVITYVCFMAGERLVALLGKGGMNIVTRLMGLILAVIGVQMLIEGVLGAAATAAP